MRASYHSLMRLFFILLPLIFINESFALDCVSGSPTAGQVQINAGGVWNCDNLIINVPLSLTGAGGPILKINVALDTQITADIILNGANGINGNSAPLNGSLGGPGATGGGGVDGLSTPENAEDLIGNNLANGKAAFPDPCPHGGSGGGLFTAGNAGSVCPGNLTPPPAGGDPAYLTEFDFGPMFRGGYGGGSGGLFTGDVGTGGGGGGALHIISNGNVTIASGVTIQARGGNGGNALVDGAGGGGGSGGAVWIQSSGVISNSGTIDLRGGNGGTNITSSGNGIGGDGVYKFEDSIQTTTGSGLTSPNVTQSLKSNISCGTILPQNNDSRIYFQMLAGFFIVMMMSSLIKTLFRIPKKF